MSDQGAVVAAMQRLLAAGGSAARSVRTEVPGARLHHLEEGSGGRDVVLLHGGTGGGANWFRLLPPLSRRFRVLAPDLPGFGLSGAVEPRAPLGRVAAEYLAALLAAHDVREALVVGTSFGGLAALRLAQLAPDRVRGLLLLDSAGLGRELPLAVRLATLPGLTGIGVRPTRRGTAAVFRTLLTTDRSELPPQLSEPLIDFLFVSAVATGVPYLTRTLRLFAGWKGQREIVGPAELGALPQPISFVWGELDPFLPLAHAQRAAEHCRAAEVVVVRGCGHSPNWERPGAVLAAIESLARRTAPS